MISVEDALLNCLSLTKILETETVALRNAAGRMMPAAAIATRDQPPFPASAMDGYAIAADPAPGDTLNSLASPPLATPFSAVLPRVKPFASLPALPFLQVQSALSFRKMSTCPAPPSPSAPMPTPNATSVRKVRISRRAKPLRPAGSNPTISPFWPQ